MGDRVLHTALQRKLMSAEEAAQLVLPEGNVGMSGFTGSGYPKAVPLALARRIMEAHLRDEPFKINVWTGASTAPELDGALAMVDGMEMRLPYQSDPTSRRRINAGDMEYTDIHLSHVPQFVRYGFLGNLDVAIIEVTAILANGRMIPALSVGNNKTWLDRADKVILEVNYALNPAIEGMHDIYYGTSIPPHRQPIPLIHADDRIGIPHFICPEDKILAVVETNNPDRNTRFAPPDTVSQRIAENLIEFFRREIKHGRLPANLLPIQSGVGNIANAVLAGLHEGNFHNLTAYTEVIQDGMMELLRTGALKSASATAFSLSPEWLDEFNQNIDQYRDLIVLRPQGISNHPEVIRRLGCIAMNGMIEADIYGNVNSTHIMGSQVMNGIGGSGDFARNGFLSVFMSPSTAKKGAISAIVPYVSHTDHTEHDVHVLVTEHGLADLRGLSPKQRAKLVIENCAHPDYRPALRDYVRRAGMRSVGKHTPHILEEALSWHTRYLNTGAMHPELIAELQAS